MFFVAMANNQRAIDIGFACAAAGIVGYAPSPYGRFRFFYFPSTPIVFSHSVADSGQWVMGKSVGRSPYPCPPFA